MPKKHRGRPATDNPKSARVDVRLTEEELKLLDEYCQKAGVSRPQGITRRYQSPQCKKNKGKGKVCWQTYLHHSSPNAAPPTGKEPHKYYTMCGSVLQAADFLRKGRNTIDHEKNVAVICDR